MARLLERGVGMADFTLTERTEPFTLEEVFEFIDDTNISKIDAHELKSRIVDVVQDTRNKAIDEFAEAIKQDVTTKTFGARECDIDRIAEQMKGE